MIQLCYCNFQKSSRISTFMVQIIIFLLLRVSTSSPFYLWKLLVFLVATSQYIMTRLYFLKIFSAERAFLGCGPRNSLECDLKKTLCNLSCFSFFWKTHYVSLLLLLFFFLWTGFDSWKFLLTINIVFFFFLLRGKLGWTVENFSALFCFCFCFFYSLLTSTRRVVVTMLTRNH